jgi:hypothetical protein
LIGRLHLLAASAESVGDLPFRQFAKCTRYKAISVTWKVRNP